MIFKIIVCCLGYLPTARLKSFPDRLPGMVRSLGMVLIEIVFRKPTCKPRVLISLPNLVAVTSPETKAPDSVVRSLVSVLSHFQPPEQLNKALS